MREPFVFIFWSLTSLIIILVTISLIAFDDRMAFVAIPALICIMASYHVYSLLVTGQVYVKDKKKVNNKRKGELL